MDESGDDSVNTLIQTYNLVELLEKEPLRLAFENKIKELSILQNLGEEVLYPTYKEQIRVSGPESWNDLYKAKDNEEPNRDLYLRLKFKSLNDLREKDAQRIRKLEELV